MVRLWFINGSIQYVISKREIHWGFELVWLSSAQSVGVLTLNHFNWLYLLSVFESKPELSVQKLYILCGCQLLKLGLCQINVGHKLIQGDSLGSLNTVIKTDSVCSLDVLRPRGIASQGGIEYKVHYYLWA